MNERILHRHTTAMSVSSIRKWCIPPNRSRLKMSFAKKSPSLSCQHAKINQNFKIHSRQKCLLWVAYLWSRILMFQRVGIKEWGLPLSPAFQYLILSWYLQWLQNVRSLKLLWFWHDKKDDFLAKHFFNKLTVSVSHPPSIHSGLMSVKLIVFGHV